MLTVYAVLCLLLSALLGAIRAVPVGIHRPRKERTSRYFNLTITEGTVNPDGGLERFVLLINGHFPGPLLEMYEGEHITVFVQSQVSVEHTVHWHGISQLGSPWSDGVPGVTQLPIAPGGSFTYRWIADQPGNHWYHAHYGLELEDGLSGPIIIHSASDRPAPFHLISSDVNALEAAHRSTHIMQIRDWNHLTSQEQLDIWHASNIEPLCASSVLINGHGSVVCPPAEEMATYGEFLTPKGCPNITSRASRSTEWTNLEAIPDSLWHDCIPAPDSPLEVVEVDPSSGWASLSFVNTGSHMDLKVSVDEHPMIVYSADGHYHEPQEVHTIQIPSVNLIIAKPLLLILGITESTGQRYQAFIKLDKPAEAYTIRAAVVDAGQALSGFAILQYTSAPSAPELYAKPGYPPLPPSKPYIDYTGHLVSEHLDFLEPLSLAPYPASPPPLGPADATFHFSFGAPSALEWALNGTGLRDTHLINPPLLWDWISAKNGGDPSICSVENGSIVDLIFHSVQTPPHSMHKHGNKAYVIGAGNEAFNWTTVAEANAVRPDLFNWETPSIRDGWNTLGAFDTPAWMVVRYLSTVPMPTLLHCHIDKHMAGGMLAVILESMDNLPAIPIEYALPELLGQ